MHHCSPQYDQTTGLRVSFADGFFSSWFYLPPILLGFDPVLIGACFGVILGYQQWLNTPSNHRVHHGGQAQYQDRNYGAILILWDRLGRLWHRPDWQPAGSN